MIGILLALVIGLLLLPIILGLFLYHRSRIIALILFGIPFTLVVIGSSWYVYESNKQFVKSTNLSEIYHEDIRVGDTLQEVIQKYGTQYYKRVEQGMSIIGYVDRTNNTFIEFWHYNEEIYEIRSNFQ